MSKRPLVARILFSAFSTPANRATWRAVVAAGAMIGTAGLASAEEKKAPPPDASRNEPARPSGPVLQLDQPTFEFGSLGAGKKKSYTVTFTNVGVVPLQLDKKKVISSCTCLVATFPKATIAPGATGKVKLTFTAPRVPGDAEHTLIIKYVIGGKQEASATITFTGVVEARRPRTRPARFEGRGFVLG